MVYNEIAANLLHCASGDKVSCSLCSCWPPTRGCADRLRKEAAEAIKQQFTDNVAITTQVHKLSESVNSLSASHEDVSAFNQQLQADIAMLSSELAYEKLANQTIPSLHALIRKSVKKIKGLKNEVERLTRERDAAVQDIEMLLKQNANPCIICIQTNAEFPECKETGSTIATCTKTAKWRGVQEGGAS